jgi:hypothetical protein
MRVYILTITVNHLAKTLHPDYKWNKFIQFIECFVFNKILSFDLDNDFNRGNTHNLISSSGLGRTGYKWINEMKL